MSTIPAIKNILILAAPIGIGIVIGSFTQYIDKFLLSFLDTYQLAVYATASADIPFVGVIVINMSLYFMPAIQESYKNNSLEKTKKYISDLFLFGWYLNVIIFTLMFSNADYIIALLYTNKYIESVTIFKILSFSYLLRVVSYSHLIIALGLEKIIIKRMLIEMILQITVSIILLKIFGIYGLAFSAFLVLVFWSVPYNLNYINKVLKSKITEILPFKSMLTFFVKCFVPYYSLNYILISYTSLSRISSLIFSIGFLLIINNREIRYLLNNNK
ncbi:MAG: hypothetical protein Q7U47_06475 [Paludibacter sp.]|nr:hypothetical protein [Paludibacter sp.]